LKEKESKRTFNERSFMMNKKWLRILGAIMLIAAAGFFVFAITHPTASFPWSNAVTYTIYGVYLLVTVVLLAAPVKQRQ